ncbi:MAG: NADH-quinone oxidoreductase subunit NuoE family protein [Desulfurispora sp.]|uniref:NADH-quinone oxidoreductase subunit NuoE family protein n=1 Tax=Desulfurispora sp. TaxID=3014275 RepID=UPI004049D316
MSAGEIEQLLAACPPGEGRLLALLAEVQKRYRYLPFEVLEELAKVLQIPLSRLFAMATFYAAFSLTPRGEKVIALCRGTACHVRGAEQVGQALAQKLGIAVGQTTPDGQFTLEEVRCLGCCSLAPVVSVDGRVYGRLGADQVGRMLDGLAGGEGIAP